MTALVTDRSARLHYLADLIRGFAFETTAIDVTLSQELDVVAADVERIAELLEGKVDE
jgi:hypothetical protein